MNKCIFIGRVGKDPEIRAMQNGNEVASFSLAVSERYKDKDGNKQEKTEWVKIVCFNKGLVSLIRGYVNKGSQIMVCGKMQTRKWQDQSGADKYTTEIVLDAFNGEIELLGGNPEGQSQHNQSKSNGYQPQGGASDFDDDIPFTYVNDKLIGF